jgi:hypothetical protein
MASDLDNACKRWGITAGKVAKKLGMSASLLKRELRNRNLDPVTNRKLGEIMDALTTRNRLKDSLADLGL